MINYYQSVLKQRVSVKKQSLWYSIGSGVFSLSSVILLFIVTRVFGANEAGIFSIGWAVSQLMLTIGLFGSRNYQVANHHKNIPFQIFFQSKFFTTFLMLVGTIIYGFLIHLDSNKLTIALLLTCLMMCETFADVFAGFLQTNNRLDISGKSYLGRVIAYDTVFILLSIITSNLVYSLIGAILISSIWLFLIDYQFVKLVDSQRKSISFSDILQLLTQSFPIFLSAFLTNFIMNSPKNAIELNLTNDFQTIYNILFMPSAVIALFSSFIFVPMYAPLSNAWHTKDYSKFLKIVKKLILIVSSLTVIILIAGGTIGLPILTLIYNVNISEYRIEFLILLLAGGLNSLSYLLIYLLTVFDRQKILLFIYGFVAILATLSGNYLVKSYNLLGASLLYGISCLIITILLFITIFNTFKTKGDIIQ